ncbi:MAG: HDOD domain-containing protein [Deltaproteobacteria bacterium]|nr:HDOD domain-containing protein [Deltaproteobacteria bacterium]
MESEQSFDLIEKIENAMIESVEGGLLAPDIIETLDDPNANGEAIESLKSKIAPDICMRLFDIANAIYFASLRRGKIGSFYEAVIHLGMHKTKVLIFTLALYRFGRGDREVETVFAGSYATSVMAHMLALQMGFREEAAKRAELAGLLMDIGRMMMLVYRKFVDTAEERIDDHFIDTFHPYLGARIVGRFNLPGYVKTIILARALILEENHVSLPGVVHLAHENVRSSFERYDNRLVIRCQIPKPATDVSRTLEAILRDKFRAVGLDQYLHIIRIPSIYDL